MGVFHLIAPLKCQFPKRNLINHSCWLLYFINIEFQCGRSQHSSASPMLLLLDFSCCVYFISLEYIPSDHHFFLCFDSWWSSPEWPLALPDFIIQPIHQHEKKATSALHRFKKMWSSSCWRNLEFEIFVSVRCNQKVLQIKEVT